MHDDLRNICKPLVKYFEENKPLRRFISISEDIIKIDLQEIWFGMH